MAGLRWPRPLPHLPVRLSSDGIWFYRLAHVSDGIRTVSFGYDTYLRLSSATNAAGGADIYGNSGTYTPPKITSVTRPAGNRPHTQTYSLPNVGRVGSQTDAYGNTTTLAVDSPTNGLSLVTNADGSVHVFAHIESRLTAAARDAAGRVWTNEYDVHERGSAVQDRLGDRVSFVWHEPSGKLAAFTNAAGQGLRHTYLAQDQTFTNGATLTNEVTFTFPSLAQTDFADGTREQYTRAGCGNVLTRVDRATHTWRFAWNSRGQLVAVTHPSGGAMAFTYNPDGTLATRSDAAGRGTNWTYGTGESIAVRRDEWGRLVATDGLVVQRDIAGRVTNTVDAGVGFGASYDAGRRLATGSYNNGAFRVTYTYDAVAGRLVRVADNLVGAHVDFLYDADERLVGIRRGNGVHTTLTRDAVGRVTRVQDGGILDLRYTLDAAGRVVREERVAPLDPATMLVTAVETNAVDGACRFIAPGDAWDVRGRLTNVPGRELRWDAASRLTGMNAVAFSYNGLGGLRTRTIGGVTTRFHYNLALALAPVVAERNEATGQFERYYVWTPNGTLLYMIETAGGHQVRYFHFDRSGSTLALTDAAGNVTNAYAYIPFGRLLGHTGTSSQSFTLVGQGGVWMADTNGLYHVRARWYDAQAGRFLTLEPVWPQVENPQLINPYQYAFNNPISFLDLTGEGAFLNDRTRFDVHLSMLFASVPVNAPLPEPLIRNGMWVYDKENRQWTADEGMLNWNRISREPARPSPFEKAMDQKQKRLWQELFDELAGRQEVPRRKPYGLQEVCALEALNNLRFRHYEPQGLPVTAKLEVPRLPVEIHGPPDEVNARPLSLDDLALAAESVSEMDPELFKELAREAGLDSR